MSKKPAYQRALIWMGVSLVALAAAAFVAVVFVIDWNQYKDTLADLTSDRLGVRVELGGDLRLSFLPRPTVVANGVRLSPLGAENGNTIATADQIGMRLGLFAALSGDLQLQSLELDGLATKAVEVDGQWRLDGWPVSESDPADQQETSSSSIILDRIQITGGAIDVQSENGEQYKLEGLTLDLSGSVPNGPLEWTGSVFLAQQPLTTQGRITPTRGGDLAVKTKIVAAGSELEVSGRLTGESAFSGRLQLNSSDISRVVDFIATVRGAQPSVMLPKSSLKLDLQLEHEAGITNLVSRRFSVDDSVGQIDLTMAGGVSAPNVTGTVTLGIVQLDAFVDVLGDTSESLTTAAEDGSASTSTGGGVLELLSGSVDVSVESVSLRGSVIQNVEATLAMSDGSIFIDRFQALLPGASRFQYLAESGGAGGAITFDTSRLRHVLSWAGVQLPTEIPTGRLMTANLTTKLALVDNEWTLSGISGRFDTSQVVGQLRGTIAPFALSTVDVSVDQLNLDAYWPDNKFATTEDGAASAVDFNLSVGSLRFRSEDYRDLKVRGGSAPNVIRIDQASVAHGDGQLQLSGMQQGITGGSNEIDANISFVDWNFPIVSAIYSDNFEQLNQLLATAPYSGSLRLSGPESQIQTNAVIRNTQRELTLAGQIEYSDNISLRLQGSYRDNKPLALITASDPRFGTARDTTLPATNLSVVLDGELSDLTYSTSGSFLGGQLDLQGVSQQKSALAEVTYSVEEISGAPMNTLLGRYGDLLPKNGARRVRANLGFNDNEITVSNLLLRAGAEEVSGTATFRPALGEKLGKMSGKLAVLRVNLDRMLTVFDELQASAPRNDGNAGDQQLVSELSGVLELDLTDVVLKGQTIRAGNAKLEIAEDQSISLGFGEGALLNASAMDATISFNPDSGALDAKVNTAALDIGSFMRSLEAGRVISGTVALNTNLTAQGKTLDAMLSTLNGDLEVKGSAGALYFIAVQELVNTINSAQNPTSFLASIGELLRGGQTDFAAIDSAVRLDGGVALVDKLNVSGTWGTLSLDGQVNFPAELMNLQGALNLANPVGAPSLPVVFEGSLSSPTTRWTSRALERFAIAGIERRIRNRIFGELETAQGQSETPPASPGTAILGTAFGLLDKLKQRQEEKKREEATKAAAAQETEKQTP